MQIKTKYEYEPYYGTDEHEARAVQLRAYRAWRRHLRWNRFRFWLFGGVRPVGKQPRNLQGQGNLLRRLRTDLYWWIQRAFKTETWREYQEWRASLPGYSNMPGTRHVIMFKRRR